MGFGTGAACAIQLNSSLTQAEKELYQNRTVIQDILQNTRTIAMIGLSTERQKASYFVATYLLAAGYTVIPVNPKADAILGQTSYPDLRSVPVPIDLVDVFRPAADCLQIVQEAITCRARAIWFQLKVIPFSAAALAREAGLATVMDLCVKMEHGRYHGGLHAAGMNTEIISAKRAQPQGRL